MSLDWVDSLRLGRGRARLTPDQHAPRTRETYRVAAPAFVILLAAALASILAVDAGHLFAFDFRRVIWDAGRAVWHGRNPYPRADAKELAARISAPVYPPPVFLAALPLIAVTFAAAAAIWTALNVSLLAIALWLIGCRDRWIFAIVAISAPVQMATKLGQPAGLLAFGAALAWRFRNNARASSAAVGATVVAKLVLWPLLVWMAFSRRIWPAIAAATAAVTLALVSWAVIGFHGFTTYPSLLRANNRAFQADGLSPAAAASRLDTSTTVAVSLVLAAFLAGLWLSRRNERRSYALALCAAVAASPIVWVHTTVLLLLALALVQPTFSAIWLLPLGFWFAGAADHPSTVGMLIGQATIAAIVVACIALSPGNRVHATTLAAETA